jgi:outer membrane protein assembly factor BamB
MRAHWWVLAALLVAGCLQPAPAPTATPAPAPTLAPTAVACTQEALRCPDGSTVGRTGPNCEFAPCPSPAANATPAPTATPPAPEGWNHTSNPGDGDDQATALVLDAQGNAYLGGTETLSGTSDTRWRVEKLDREGRLVWSYASKPSPNNALNALALDARGFLYLAGSQLVAGSDTQWRAEKLNASTGENVWNYTSNPGAFFDSANALALDPNGIVYLGGAEGFRTNDPPFTPGTKWRLEKLSPEGVREWDFNVNNSGVAAAIQALAFDPAGGHLVAAGADRALEESGWRVERINPSPRASVWVYKSAARLGSAKLAFALALDAAGNAYVAGTDSVPGGVDAKWLVEKLSPAGALLWTHESDFGEYDDRATSLALAPDGSLFAAGYGGDQRAAASNAYWRVERLSGADGSLQWSRWTDPGDANDHARALALDAQGFLHVAGSQRVAPKDFQFRLEKFRP